MKRVLFIFPHGLGNIDTGAKSRFKQIVSSLYKNNFIIDQIGYLGYDTTSRSLNDYKIAEINRVLLLKKNKSLLSKLLNKLLGVDFNSFINFIIKLNKVLSSKILNIFSFKREINHFTQNVEYDYIIFTYIYWDFLYYAINTSAKKILMIDDIVSINSPKEANVIKRSKSMGKEIFHYTKYDKVLFVSYDEYTIYNLLTCSKNGIYIPPHFVFKDFISNIKEFDLVFVGSNNEHNIKGINWFINHVLPLIQNPIKILIVGSICNSLKFNISSIQQIEHIDNIEEIYSISKIAICPMFSGSGVKIKVLEALSFGIPVVTSFWGVIGLPLKLLNGCEIADNNIEFANKITMLLSSSSKQEMLKVEAKYLISNIFSYEKYNEKIFNVFS